MKFSTKVVFSLKAWPRFVGLDLNRAGTVQSPSVGRCMALGGMRRSEFHSSAPSHARRVTYQPLIERATFCKIGELPHSIDEIHAADCCIMDLAIFAD